MTGFSILLKLFEHISGNLRYSCSAFRTDCAKSLILMGEELALNASGRHSLFGFQNMVGGSGAIHEACG